MNTHDTDRVDVESYCRKDGTFVRGHTRSWPEQRPTHDMVADTPGGQRDALLGLSGLLIIALFVYRDTWWPLMVAAYQWAIQANLPWWLYVVGYVCLSLLLRQVWWWLVAAVTLALLVSAGGWLLSLWL